MILICRSCHTRFQVEDAVLRRPGGRLVRCAGCGHRWRHLPEDAAPLRAEPVAPSAMPPPPPVPLAAAERDPLPPPAPRRSHWAAIVAVSAILIILGAAVAFAVVERRAIVARFPAAARLYADAGLPAAPLAAMLKIEKIKPVRTAAGLLIEGEIANPGKDAQDLPQLRVALQDAADKEVQFKIVPPPQPRLGPGEVAHFQTPFQHPAEAAKNVVVTFAAR